MITKYGATTINETYLWVLVIVVLALFRYDVNDEPVLGDVAVFAEGLDAHAMSAHVFARWNAVEGRSGLVPAKPVR